MTSLQRLTSFQRLTSLQPEKLSSCVPSLQTPSRQGVVCGWWEVEVGGKNGREEIFMAVTLPMHADTVLDLKRFADVFGQSVESVRVGPSDQVEDMRCAQRCHHFPEGRVTQDTTEFCFGFLQVGGKKKKKEWGISLQWQFLLLLPAGWAGWLGLVTHEKAEKDRTGSG